MTVYKGQYSGYDPCDALRAEIDALKEQRKTVWVLTDGDLNDYDAPAPRAIFATEREAWEHVSKSLTFVVYANGTTFATVDYHFMYEMPFGVDINMREVPEKLIPSWCDISGEVGRHWQP